MGCGPARAGTQLQAACTAVSPARERLCQEQRVLTCTATALPSTSTSPTRSRVSPLSTTSDPVLSLPRAEVPVSTYFSSGL